jgi:uncharacterized membrane protein
MRAHFDNYSIIVILITFVLFVLALFTKGITHDLLLEAGVLLVSIKIIHLSYKSGVRSSEVSRKLDEIKELLEENTR